MKTIQHNKYHDDLVNFFKEIPVDYDCIVALKRSGWIMGAYFSNQSSKPVFTQSEILSIPDKFKNILIVDDKICKGKSIQTVKNKLEKRGLTCLTACLYVEGEVLPDYFAHDLGGIHKMWYEK